MGKNIVRASVFMPINEGKLKSINEGEPFYFLIKGDSEFGQKQLGLIKRNTTKFSSQIEKLKEMYGKSEIAYFQFHSENITEDDEEKSVLLLDNIANSEEEFVSENDKENTNDYENLANSDYQEKGTEPDEQDFSLKESYKQNSEIIGDENVDVSITSEKAINKNEIVQLEDDKSDNKIENELVKEARGKIEKFDISSLGEFSISEIKELDARKIYSLSEIDEKQEAYSRKEIELPSVDQLLEEKNNKTGNVVKRAI
ncbi:hypothetical protein P7D73_18035 [Enterococcus raffinosus]|uniref:hypothetical protein n=1 Tax=Enterococcus raffinosus TaxID=71452 RepID=UPI00288E08E9|nr:hypothetical protein [Enterococcus raffinosus]MDT2525106.1 hypothetical protein [Enterococcus raffinosus]MDT2592461.1 hypothetical protein [Enterococcus raffinosus]